MRSRLARAVALLLFLLPGLQPLLSRQLTCGFDNNFHLWRSVQIGALLDEGILFSRWAPHMAQGFGYPLYLFQSPFSAYLTAVFHLLGFPWSIALNLVYALGFVGSAYAMWLLARDLWGERGGLLAAVIYAYAPFHAYVLFYRASLSETVAWLFPPLILWGLRRWQQQGERRGLLTAVFSFLLLIWTHDVTAYALFPLFVGWVVVQKRPWRGGLAFLLAFASGAFFWLPALAERGAVQFDRANSAWPFLYFNNFLPLNNFLALPRNADPTLLNDWPPRALGLILLLLALAGGLLAWRRHCWRCHRQRWLVGLLLAALVGYTFLILPVSRPLWDNISLLTAFQFPWRFLAAATLIGSLLAGGIFSDELLVSRYSGWTSPVFLGMMALFPLLHWGWFYPPHCDAPSDLTVAGMVAWEEATLTTGTTAKDELRPTTVQRKPPTPDTPVWESRFSAAQLPAGATMHVADMDGLGATLVVETAVSFIATYQAFAFPGWRVAINGRFVPITPSTPEGLITFPVPAGHSEIAIRFGETPLRLAADGLSLLSLLLVGLLAYRARPTLGAAGSPATSLDSRSLLLFGVLLLAFKIGLVDQEWTPLRRSRLTAEQQLVGIDVARPLLFGAGNRAEAKLALLGYDELATTISVNDYLDTLLYWQPLNVAGSDYRVGLTLVDENGLRWSEAGLRDSRWYRNPPPSRSWPLDSYALTAYWLDPLPGTPPGRYTLELSVFDRQSLAPLTIFDEAGQPLGPTLPLTAIDLTLSDSPWPLAPMQFSLADCQAANGPCLWGSNLDRAEAAPGDSVLVTLFWSGLQTADLQLLDAQDDIAATWPLTFPNLPAGFWRLQQQVRLPLALADGHYRWRLANGGGETAVSWGSLTISNPDRLLTAPPLDIPLDTTFGQQITLWGADVVPNHEDGTLTVKLAWRGEQLLDNSYHVFLHLVDADGNLLAQSDGVPAGNRPTTGWLPGEYVVDMRQLPLPAGEFRLRVGLYLPDNGRLLTTTGEDFVEFK